MFESLATTSAKLVQKVLRKSGRGATTLPGKIALAISPKILSQLSEKVKVIIVTGTNGKTTTCRMIEEGLKQNNRSYFCNKSGANLITGITTAFIENVKSNCDYAIIECDENAFKKVSLYINPYIVVVTNIFRDQLDRYGEVSNTLDAIKQSLNNISSTNLVLNADCSLTSSLAKVNENNRIYFFGINQNLGDAPEISDAKYCIFCKNEYQYSFNTFAHLGGFCCSNCGYRRHKPDVSAEKILNFCDNKTDFELKIFSQSYSTTSNIPGVYNIYNFLASALVLKLVGIENKKIISAVSNAECAFGRMEKFVVNGKNIFIILVKNPAGFSQVISYISSQKKPYSVAFCLNDNAADGKDVSWIWDVCYDGIFDENSKLKNIYVSGKRAYDMALAIDYNMVKKTKIEVIENCDYDKLIKVAESCDEDFFIVPTYTSMMALRPLFAQRFGGREFWK